MLFILDAATGLRAGEVFGLEIRHFDGHSIKVEQSVWRGDAQAPKTPNAYRVADLYPDVAKLLSGFIGDRKSGYIFCTSSGKPLGQSNVLRRYLHPVLKKTRNQTLRLPCLPSIPQHVPAELHLMPEWTPQLLAWVER
jgi:integrase